MRGDKDSWGLADEIVEGIVLSENGRVIDANKSFVRMFGYELDEVIGMDLSKFLVAEEQESADRRISSGSEEVSLYRGVRKDGADFSVEVRPRQTVWDGREVRVIVVLDVDERARAEDELRRQRDLYEGVLAAQSALGEGFVIVEGRRIVYANEGFCRIIGYEPEEIAELPSFMDLIVDEEREPLMERRKRRLEGGEGETHYDTVLRHKDGHRVEVEVAFKASEFEGRPRFIILVRDISERKRVEEALGEIEERYRVVAETASDVIVMIDEDSRVLFVNSAVEKVFGYTREELLDQRLTMLMPEPMRPLHEAALERYIESGERRLDWDAIQLPGLHKSGGKVPVEISFGELVKDGRRRFTGFIRDITERKKIEQALKESEERYRAVIEQAAEGIILIDLDDYHVLEANPEFRRLFGYTSEDVAGLTIYDLVAHDRETVDRNIERTLEEGDRIVGERRYRRRDGSLVDVMVSGSTISYGGRRALSLLIRDITGRKNNENALRFLAEASEILGSSLDYKATLSSVARLAVPHLADWCAVDVVENEGTLERLAVTHEDPQKVELAYELERRYPPDPEAPQGVPNVMRTGEPEMVPEIPASLLVEAAVDEEHLALLEQLAIRSYMIVPLIARGQNFGALTLVAAESGRRYGPEDLEMAEDLARRAAVAIDNAKLYEEAQREIAERKKTESELEARAEDLRRSNAELEQFAYVASHDLQEPLRMVSSYTQLLARRYKDQLDDDAREFIGYAVDGAERMQRLINDLLVYSRVGTRGKEFAPTDCEEVFEAVRDNLQVSLDETGAELVSGELPTVMGDRSQLIRLLQNLVGNALKFKGQEPPEIHVEAERRDEEWLFSVRDNGIGIAPEYADRIFVIFQRLHDRLQYPGTGIGLAVCKKIVERHGGRIWVESKVGEGSTFYFTLPESRRRER